MRKIMVQALVLTASLLLIAPQACAASSAAPVGVPLNIGVPYLVGPGFTYAEPFSIGGLFVQAFNTSTLAHDYAGSLAISFQPFAGQDAAGGVAATPVIAQTSSESVVATRSYFFNDIFAVV